AQAAPDVLDRATVVRLRADWQRRLQEPVHRPASELVLEEPTEQSPIAVVVGAALGRDPFDGGVMRDQARGRVQLDARDGRPARREARTDELLPSHGKPRAGPKHRAARYR